MIKIKTNKKRILFILLVVVSIFVTGCGNKEKTSTNSIKKEMKKAGYIVEEGATELLESEKAKKVYIFIDKKFTYQIEYYDFKDEKTAEKKFKSIKDLYEAGKTDKSKEDSSSGGNNERYEITTDDKYSVVSRIDTTVIYSSAPIKYKEAVEKAMDNIKY